MIGNSFDFGPYNSVRDWNIQVIAHDFLSPPKRERKVEIPDRHGSYDYGAKYYGERILRMSCMWERRGGETSRHALREAAYELSEKRQLRLWNEPDKYYVGELFDGAELEPFPKEQYYEFELNFVCEPFAYGAYMTVPLQRGVTPILYKGTADSPPLILIRNTGVQPVQTVQITTIRRE